MNFGNILGALGGGLSGMSPLGILGGGGGSMGMMSPLGMAGQGMGGKFKNFLDGMGEEELQQLLPFLGMFGGR